MDPDSIIRIKIDAIFKDRELKQYNNIFKTISIKYIL